MELAREVEDQKGISVEEFGFVHSWPVPLPEHGLPQPKNFHIRMTTSSAIARENFNSLYPEAVDQRRNSHSSLAVNYFKFKLQVSLKKVTCFFDLNNGN